MVLNKGSRRANCCTNNNIGSSKSITFPKTRVNGMDGKTNSNIQGFVSFINEMAFSSPII